ncbi:hypothetical protein DFH07DRAFT_1008748 [Mycena maculata]|uniref:Uncharacterized protein n=1 Tax=Mycena maculata TaxID=230809 RepID=A0AAD7JMK3_9AGAR|nr:hypothetical protein DFH07DRAFT_1008748 [Mycena maculata]
MPYADDSRGRRRAGDGARHAQEGEAQDGRVHHLPFSGDGATRLLGAFLPSSPPLPLLGPSRRLPPSALFSPFRSRSPCYSFSPCSSAPPLPPSSSSSPSAPSRIPSRTHSIPQPYPSPGASARPVRRAVAREAVEVGGEWLEAAWEGGGVELDELRKGVCARAPTTRLPGAHCDCDIRGRTTGWHCVRGRPRRARVADGEGEAGDVKKEGYDVCTRRETPRSQASFAVCACLGAVIVRYAPAHNGRFGALHPAFPPFAVDPAPSHSVVPRL